ncbi:MAG: hypothetical protein JXR83_00185 [Deltaproteobacteria bacterium]|nr:hypothetical protein [Deltaproteobacteria bacterium]
MSMQPLPPGADGTALLLSLDDRAACDSGQVGAKAAWLARARRAGLPVQRAHCVRIPAPGLRRGDDGAPPLPPAIAHALERWGRCFKPLAVRLSTPASVPPRDWSARAARGPRRAVGPRELTEVVRAMLGAQQEMAADPEAVGSAILIADALEPALIGHARPCTPLGVADRVYLIEALDPARPAAIQRIPVRGDGFGEWPPAGPALLTPAQLEAIVRLADAAEQLLGTPAAIDWLWSGPRLWLTRLAPQRDDRSVLTRLGAQAAGLEVWSNFALRENLQRPMTPLTFSIWRDAFLPIVLETLTGLPGRATRQRRMLPVDRISGRIYWCVNRLRATPMGALLLAIARWLDPGAGAELARLLDRQQVEPPPLTGPRRVWAFGHSLLGFWRLVRRTLAGLAAHATAQGYRAVATAQLCAAGEPLAGRNDQELIADLGAALAQSRDCLQRGLAHEFLSVWALYLCRALWPRLARRSFDEVAAQLQPGPAAEVAVALRAIAADLAAVGIAEISDDAGFWNQSRLLEGAGLVARSRWLALLDSHGHRGAGELGVSSPRWSEDPTPLLRALRSLLGRGAPALLPLRAALEDRASVSGLARPESAAHLPVFGRPLCAALRYLTSVAALRAVPGNAFAACLHRLRVLLLEIGRRLQQRSLIADARALDLLEIEEAEDLLLALRSDLQAIARLIESRRRALLLDAESAPPDTVRSDGALDAAGSPPSSERRLTGFAASAGSAVGRGRIVRDPDRDPFAAGEVLVACSVTPGWAPLLATAAAVVTDFGEYGCHAAAMARELGIPAVVGCHGALARLPDGATLSVNGDTGVVEVLSE